MRRLEMHCGEKTHKEDKAKDAGFGCNPGDFQKMFEKMGKCCADPEGSPDCLAMMRRMAEAVRNRPCCEPIEEKTGG
jgi:hypothetical protein